MSAPQPFTKWPSPSAAVPESPALEAKRPKLSHGLIGREAIEGLISKMSRQLLHPTPRPTRMSRKPKASTLGKPLIKVALLGNHMRPATCRSSTIHGIILSLSLPNCLERSRTWQRDLEAQPLGPRLPVRDAPTDAPTNTVRHKITHRRATFRVPNFRSAIRLESRGAQASTGNRDRARG